MSEIYIGKPIQVDGDNCPNCGKFLDGCTGVGDAEGFSDPKPYAGAYSICSYCCSLLKFDDNLKLKLVPEAEKNFILQDSPIINLMVNTVERVKISRDLVLETWGGEDDPWS